MAFFQTWPSLTSLGIGSIVIFYILLCWHGGNAEIAVTDLNSNETAAIFPDMQASFGDDFPQKGLKGRVVFAQPKTACGGSIKGAPKKMDDYVWIVLIERGQCPFVEKVLNAQKANFSSAIVFNTPGDQGLTKMGGSSQDIFIPSTFVGFNTGMDLKAQYSYPRFKDFVVHIREDEEVDLKMYLLPFAVVVGVCFFMIVIFFVIKFVRDYRRSRVARLSKKHLKKIPIRKFKKGQYYDTCAVCLDEYEDGEKIRVLPCEHAYHAKCIDPWLTRNKKTCPVCKRRVIPGKDPNSDSDSDSEDGGGASQTTPLLLSAATSQRTHGSMNQVEGDSGPAPRARSAPPLFEATVVLETEGAVGGVGITTMSDGASSSTSHGVTKKRVVELDSERGEQREGRRKRRERKEAEERLVVGTEEEEDEEERRKAEKKERRRKKKEKKKKLKKNSGGSGVGEGSRDNVESGLLACPNLDTVDEVVVLNSGVVGDPESSSSGCGGARCGYGRRGQIWSDSMIANTDEDVYSGGHSRYERGGGNATTSSSGGGVLNSGFSDSQEDVVLPSTRRGGKKELSEVV